MSNLVMENNSMNDKKHPKLAKSDIIKHLPKACGDEKAAVEFFERQRWGNSPLCPHCQTRGGDGCFETKNSGSRNVIICLENCLESL